MSCAHFDGVKCINVFVGLIFLIEVCFLTRQTSTNKELHFNTTKKNQKIELILFINKICYNLLHKYGIYKYRVEENGDKHDFQ